jgi:hypothetical protein
MVKQSKKMLFVTIWGWRRNVRNYSPNSTASHLQKTWKFEINCDESKSVAVPEKHLGAPWNLGTLSQWLCPDVRSLDLPSGGIQTCPASNTVRRRCVSLAMSSQHAVSPLQLVTILCHIPNSCTFLFAPSLIPLSPLCVPRTDKSLSPPCVPRTEISVHLVSHGLTNLSVHFVSHGLTNIHLLFRQHVWCCRILFQTLPAPRNMYKIQFRTVRYPHKD